MTEIPTNAALVGFPDEATQTDPDYWFGLIGEREAGAFLGLVDRTMQVYRQRGGGPRYIHISSRCIRYRRYDLKIWAEARLRSSTSDDGAETA